MDFLDIIEVALLGLMALLQAVLEALRRRRETLHEDLWHTEPLEVEQVYPN